MRKRVVLFLVWAAISGGGVGGCVSAVQKDSAGIAGSVLLETDSSDGSSGIDLCLSQELDSLQIVINPQVERFIDYFQNKQRKHFSVWLERSCRYMPIMEEILREQGLPVELSHMALIESGFNPRAQSRARAVGPWQFMRYTGRKYGLKIDEWIDERRDPIKSTYAAARYLKDLYNIFGCWHLAAAGYNAGEGRIMRALRKSGAEDFWELTHYPYIRRETKNYVPKLLAALLISEEPEEYGFEEIECMSPLEYDEIVVEFPVDLKKIARFLEIPVKDLWGLNPELRYPFTPPNSSAYDLRVPPGTGPEVEQHIASIPPSERLTLVHHRVRRGETLSTIARRYRTRVSAIMNLNNIRNRHRIRAGQTLLIPISQFRSKTSG